MSARAVVLVTLLAAVLAACPKNKRRVVGPRMPDVPTGGDAVARERFEQTRARFERDASGTAADFEALVEEFPDDPIVPHALLYAGMSSVAAGDHEEAASTLERLDQEPGIDPVIRSRGRLYLGIALNYLGRHAEAVAALRDGGEGLDPNDPIERAEWHAASAQANLKTGRFAEAVVHYDAFYADARASERAYVLDQLRALVGDLDAAAARRLFDSLDSRDGPAAAILGERLAVEMIAAGDVSGAREIRESVARARELIGMSTEVAGGEGGDVRRVGAVLPLSGRGSRIGDLSMRGLSLASGAFADRPGTGVEVSGMPRPFALIARDSASSAVSAGKSVDELAGEDVIAVVGPIDGAATDEAAGRAAALGVPLLSLNPRSGEREDSGSPFVFHMVHSAEDRARALARHAVKAGVKDFAIFKPRSSYGRAVAAAFRDEVERRGGTVVVEADYDPRATSFKDDLKPLKKPWQAVFVPDTARRLELVAPALAAANFNARPLGEESRYGRAVLLLSTAELIGSRFLRSAGRYSWGAVLAPGFYPDRSNDHVAEFADRYEQSFGRAPTAFEAYAFDAALAVRAAVEAGATTRAEISAALAAGAVNGLTGTVRFDASRRRADDGVLYTVEQVQADQYEIRALR